MSGPLCRGAVSTREAVHSSKPGISRRRRPSRLVIAVLGTLLSPQELSKGRDADCFLWSLQCG